jgi:malonyl-CoA O-methyltransferase
MPHPSDLDQRTIAKQFQRRAWHPDVQQHFLAADIEARMFERLEVIKLTPTRVLDVGCGFGAGTQRLQGRFPLAEVCGLEVVPERLPQMSPHSGEKTTSGWLAGFKQRWAAGGRNVEPPAPATPRWEVGDAHALSAEDHSLDLIWSNLTWSWLVDPPRAVKDWYRALAPQGLLMMSGFGVDTMRQWRELASDLGLPAAPEFADMHDVGDLLVKSGLADPVMDTERLTLTYRDADRLIRDVCEIGGDGRRSRKYGLSTPRHRNTWHDALDKRRNAQGLIELTVEVVFAHAWAAPDKLQRIERQRLKEAGFSPLDFKRR